jgi:hypothetical protein
MDTSNNSIILGSNNLTVSGANFGVFGGNGSLAWSLDSTTGDITSVGNVGGSTLSGTLQESDIAPGANGEVLTTVGGVASWAAAAGGTSNIATFTSLATQSVITTGNIDFDTNGFNNSGVSYAGGSFTLPIGIWEISAIVRYQKVIAGTSNIVTFTMETIVPVNVVYDTAVHTSPAGSETEVSLQTVIEVTVFPTTLSLFYNIAGIGGTMDMHGPAGNSVITFREV